MITAMNEKLEALEAKNSLLMERQTTLERKESHIEDQLHELCNTSVGTGFAAGKATKHFFRFLLIVT